MIKTIVEFNAEDFDTKINAFCQVKPVFATQTHVQQVYTSVGPTIQYTAILFYKDPLDYNKS